MYLTCLAQLEQFSEAYRVEANFSHNMHQLTLSIIKQMRCCNDILGKDMPEILKSDLIDELIPIKGILKPFLGGNDVFSELEATTEVLTTEYKHQPPISSDTLKLVDENIFSAAASQNDPNLFSGISDNKQEISIRVDKTVKETRTKALLEKLETVHPSLSPKAFKQLKWVTL